MERYIAIDNVCAWPNLTLLPNGEIIATIFNHPEHAAVAGTNVECWASENDGRLWKFRGTPDSPPEGESRVNQAAGLDGDGALIQRLCLLVIPLGPMQRSQVIEAFGGGGVLGARDPLVNPKCAPIERLCLLEIPLGPKQLGQVVEA